MFIHVAHSQSFAIFPLSLSVYVCPTTTTRCFEFWLCDMHFCVCVCRSNNNKRIILFDDMAIKIHFFSPTEHRLMTMAAWAIKSRIFTSLKRALNLVETFFYGNFISDWNFKQFPAPFLLYERKSGFFPFSLIVFFIEYL